MNNSTKILLGTLLLAVVFTAGRFSKPTKVETKEVIKVVTQKEEAKTRIVYRDKITKPDGTIIEKEVEREDTQSKEVATLDKATQTVTTNATGLTLSVLGVKSIKDLGGETGAQIGVSKRLIGALGLSGSFTGYKDEKLAAIGLSWSF